MFSDGWKEKGDIVVFALTSSLRGTFGNWGKPKTLSVMHIIPAINILYNTGDYPAYPFYHVALVDTSAHGHKATQIWIVSDQLLLYLLSNPMHHVGAEMSSSRCRWSGGCLPDQTERWHPLPWATCNYSHNRNHKWAEQRQPEICLLAPDWLTVLSFSWYPLSNFLSYFCVTHAQTLIINSNNNFT